MSLKFINNKKLSISLIIILIVLAIIGGTFAFFMWEVNESQKTIISLRTGDGSYEIIGGNVEKTGMHPTANCGGDVALIGDVATLEAVNASSSDMEASLKIRATLSTTHGTMTSAKRSKLNWAVVETTAGTTCETTPYKGTFSSVSAANTDIDTGISFVVSPGTAITKTYQIYVWLDITYEHKNLGNDISDPMQDLFISVKFSPGSQLVQLPDSVSDDIGTSSSVPNAPVLDSGMIPVKIANNGTVTTVSSTDSTWYNYNNKQWANAVLVKSSGTKTRDYYKSNTGVTIPESDILAYYVWIPRYKYRIFEKKCSEVSEPSVETYPSCYAPYTMSDDDKTNFIQFVQMYVINAFEITDFTLQEATELVENGLQSGVFELEGIMMMGLVETLYYYNSSVGGNVTATPSSFNGNNTIPGPNTIDIVFESKDAIKSTGDAVNTYYTHPAFAWGSSDIDGFWVGKFEMTGDETTPTIKPNVSSLRNIDLNSQYNASLKMAGNSRVQNGPVGFAESDVYGVEAHTGIHVIKNSEWGAVAYLSHSQYGINTEVRLNNNYNYITGCGASEENGEGIYECQIAYGSGVSSYPQSTTGNITGVFDMSGGSEEYVMGNIDKLSGSSNFTYFSQTRYYNLYLSSQFVEDHNTNFKFCTLETCGGHALYEVSSWYNDIGLFIDSDCPWFTRGGRIEDNVRAGVFNSMCLPGHGFGTASWRSVLLTDEFFS